MRKSESSDASLFADNVFRLLYSPHAQRFAS